jgi:hemerythrin
VLTERVVCVIVNETRIRKESMGDTGEFVHWEHRYELDIKVVDEQHKELVRLINTLYDACRDGDTKDDAFKTAIKGAVDYVKVHFADEERLLEGVKYPALEEHKAEHAAFVRQVLESVQNFEKGLTFAPNTFVRFLSEWVLTHIALSDKKYADYIKHLKKSGAEA